MRRQRQHASGTMPSERRRERCQQRRRASNGAADIVESLGESALLKAKIEACPEAKATGEGVMITMWASPPSECPSEGPGWEHRALLWADESTPFFAFSPSKMSRRSFWQISSR